MAQRAYAKDVTLSLFGTMNMIVELVPRLNSAKKAAEFPHICPECATPTKIKQLYACSIESSHGPYEDRTALPQAREIDKMLVAVTPEEIEHVRTEGLLPKGEMSLIVVPKEQIEAQTQPSMSGYRVRPGATSSKVYAMVRDLLRDSPYALVGELNLRNSQKLYRLIVWNDQLCLQELIRPDEIAPADEIDGEYDARWLDKASQLIEALSEDFNADDFRNQVAERATALDAAKANGQGTPIVSKAKAKPDTTGDDLLAALEASLDAAKPKPKAKAKTK